MSSDEPEMSAGATTEARAFLGGFRSLVLATTSTAGEPEASYAPFVRDRDGSFLVYVSELSRHTGNLKDSGRASILLLADEQDTGQAFARRRLTFRCGAREVPRGDLSWAAALASFEERFGEIVKTLRELQDFHLFALTAEEGAYVRGFGQAYRIVERELDALLARSTEPTR